MWASGGAGGGWAEESGGTEFDAEFVAAEMGLLWTDGIYIREYRPAAGTPLTASAVPSPSPAPVLSAVPAPKFRSS